MIMEIIITARLIWNIMLIISWVIFVGLSIEAGSFIVNTFFAIVNPAVVPHLWQQIDLSDLFKHDHGHFFAITLILSIVTIIKALLFFLIVRLLHNKDLNIAQPFNKTVRRFIFRLSGTALLIGLFSEYGTKYAEWLSKQGIEMPDMRLAGSDVWLFMAVVLFIIAQVFKRGIEIQSENELTI